MTTDPFDTLLTLEDSFYDEGYNLGITDGTKAGRLEGRVFGLEKGFEKYVEMGKLHGRSLIWNSRHAALRSDTSATRQPTYDNVNKGAKTALGDAGSSPDTKSETPEPQPQTLRELPGNARLEKHLRVLYALTEPRSLSTENSEASVSDFDDRLKRAQGKVKIIERVVGDEKLVEMEGRVTASEASAGSGDGQNIEDVDILKARH